MPTQIGGIGYSVSSILVSVNPVYSSHQQPRKLANAVQIDLLSNKNRDAEKPFPRKFLIECSQNQPRRIELRTCKNCKTQFDPLLNHPRSCRFHTAHFGGETKRKFESVHTGGTMDTPDSGKVFQYWHCCGSEDPFDPGCTAAPHASYDD